MQHSRGCAGTEGASVGTMVGERGMEVCGVAAGGCTGGGKDLNCQSVSQSVFRNGAIKKKGAAIRRTLYCCVLIPTRFLLLKYDLIL